MDIEKIVATNMKENKRKMALTSLILGSFNIDGYRRMRRFIFIVILLLPVSSLADSLGHCSIFIHGIYPDAHGACLSFADGFGCNAASPSAVPSEAYPYDNRWWGTYENGFFNPNSLCGYDIPGMTVHVFLRVLTCPSGSQPVAELGGACICEQGEMNYETQRCEDPKCQPPTKFNESANRCEKKCPIDKPWSSTARDCIAPPEPESCENKAFNPIDFFSGHKLQREVVFEGRGDFPLTFSWLYNSFGNHRKTGAGYSIGAGVVGETMLHTEPPLADGETRISLPLNKNPDFFYTGKATEHWRHNHSYFLAHYTLPDGVTERLMAYRPNGSDLHFVDESGTFVALANRNWRATKDLNESQEHIGWVLKFDGSIEKYDMDGRILRQENEQGQGVTYTYDSVSSQHIKITDDNGNYISLYYTDGKLTRVYRPGVGSYYFTYNGNGLLESIRLPGSGPRLFRYEDIRFPNALTGVTDEAGKVYSTFTYDDQGRAISSAHNGGADSGTVEYVNENTRRLTNALGKSTTYNFSDVGGGKRITSINGETSTNCAAANKGYSYDANGFVASETDWEGNVTTYVRDTLGRELSRIEASDTPAARVVTTEWHATFNVPTKATTPDSVTDYSYDSTGRLLSQQVTPVGSP